MNFEAIIFYIFGGIAILSALFILFTKRIIYAAFSLILTFLSVAAFYVFAGADFLAVTQVMIYVGGILVLLIFGVMFTNQKGGRSLITSNRNVAFGSMIACGILGLLVYVLSSLEEIGQKKVVALKTTTDKIGILLMSDYVLPFELAGLLLLVALIGASFLASRSVY